jgi:hypothetical protein
MNPPIRLRSRAAFPNEIRRFCIHVSRDADSQLRDDPRLQ